MFNFKSDIQFINYFRIFIFISLILIIISIGSIFYKGLNFGVDFKGGTLIELRVENTEIGIGEAIFYQNESRRCKCKKIW